MGRFRPARWRLLWWAALWVVLLSPGRLHAQAPPPGGTSREVPRLEPRPTLDALTGRPIRRLEIVTEGERWPVSDVELRRVRVGDALTGFLARQAMRELLDTGLYARVRAVAAPAPGGAVLRLYVLPRRIVDSLRVVGGKLPADDTLRAAHLGVGDEVTAPSLSDHAEQIVAYYARHGYPEASVRVQVIDTDDPMRVVVLLHVDAGEARKVRGRRLVVSPSPAGRLGEIVQGYDVEIGDRADEEALEEADDSLREQLRRAGWFRAVVAHSVRPAGKGAELVVRVTAGPEVRLEFEGNRHFDRDQLTDALDLDERSDRSTEALVEELRRFYVRRGFYDVRVRAEERGEPGASIAELHFFIGEGNIVRVVAREYPCLTGDRSPDAIGKEIDSFLSEALPGASLVKPVDPGAIDSALGPTQGAGARVAPLELNPWKTFSPEVYEQAREHLQELYRSEGYLSAVVGPVVPLRRACDLRSPPGRCLPLGDRVRPPVTCPKGDALPVEDPPPSAPVGCEPDPARGRTCEPEIVVQMPIKLGPRSILWDVSFEGNEALVEQRLAEVAALELGEPVSQVTLDQARRRMLDAYAEEGFAFARVDAELELSPDRTRASAHFIIGERERVRVKDIVVQGARHTNESLILGRVALEEGELYRRSAVRDTEERLATLGVFSSVTVGLEDPEVPAKQKVVVITVVERPPQYLDVKPGFSTGDGVRVTFEYGHRNVGGGAILLTLRVQLGFLPNALILDPDVRRKFGELDLSQRLERWNMASVEFPEIGLGPLFRLGVDAVDVRDNSRDYGLTKDATILTLRYMPTRRFAAQVGGSIELNDARIFGRDEKDALQKYLQDNPRARSFLLVPQGQTVAFAQNTGVTWDRRDDPFNATRGTYVSAGIEHVRAIPAGAASSDTIDSEFLRLTNRLAGYIPLSDEGLALALSFQWGLNVQVRRGSKTYPDRLFFLGGIDSIRGFLRRSIVPEDLVERIEADSKLPDDDPNKLTIREVAVRGGDLMVNPRAELRIPLTGIWQTAVFFDSGNLWVKPENFVPYRLRYSTGTGLRASTPVGPLALDVGLNLDRRSWENRFAFHFSIGLF